MGTGEPKDRDREHTFGRFGGTTGTFVCGRCGHLVDVMYRQHSCPGGQLGSDRQEGKAPTP